MSTEGQVQILARQLERTFARLPAVLAAFPLVGICTWLPLRRYVPVWVFVGWLLTLCAVAIGGLMMGRVFAREIRPDLLRWQRWRVIAAAVNGLVWGGFLATALFIPGDALRQTFVLFVVGGTSVTALASSSSHAPSLYTFQVTNLLPITSRLIVEGTEPSYAMAGLTVLFLVVLLGIGSRTARSEIELLRAQSSNEALMEDLRTAHARLEVANQELTERVAARTRDLTRALAEKEQKEAQLRQAERMEAVGRLAGGVAHDFNNIMTSVAGFAGLIYESLPVGDERREDLEEILDAAERASQLTHRLLGFAKGGLARPEPTELVAHLIKLGRMLARVVPDNVELCWQLPDAEVWVFIDPVQLDQLVMNLVVNAKEAQPDGGRIVVSVSSESSLSPEAEPAAMAKIEVSDDGPGIPPSILGRIFEPFFTSKGAQGTGFGLATCFGIVQRAGGSIRVFNRPPHGASFVASLPLSLRGPTPPVELPLTSPAAPRPNAATVLVVEDEEAIRTIIERVLMSQGCQVLLSSSAEHALALLAHQEPALVISDVGLPGISGLELREAARKRGLSVPFLFISGYMDPESLSEQSAAEPLSLLTKPFSPAQLLAAVHHELEPRE